MAIKSHMKEKFAASMLRFVTAVKKESEICYELSGSFNEKELFIIVFIGQNQNVKMSDIAENLRVPVSTLTTIVDKLVDRKFLIRVHSDEDRRVVNVALTNKGKNSHKVFLKRKDVMAQKLLSTFNEAEQEKFIQYLNKMSAAIESL